jgi:hypothetical protein
MTDAALPDAAPGGTPGQPAVVLRNVVIHLNNEQPVLADLFEIPSPRDIAVLCTNLRTPDGKRPVFIDQTDSTFLLPLAHIRFIEIPEGANRTGDGSAPSGRNRTAPAPAPVEPDIEIDEDFLRRIRDA